MTVVNALHHIAIHQECLINTDQQVHVLYITSATYFMIQFVSNKVFLRLAWIQLESATDDGRRCWPRAQQGNLLNIFTIHTFDLLCPDVLGL